MCFYPKKEVLKHIKEMSIPDPVIWRCHAVEEIANGCSGICDMAIHAFSIPLRPVHFLKIPVRLLLIKLGRLRTQTTLSQMKMWPGPQKTKLPNQSERRSLIRDSSTPVLFSA